MKTLRRPRLRLALALRFFEDLVLQTDFSQSLCELRLPSPISDRLTSLALVFASVRSPYNFVCLVYKGTMSHGPDYG